MARSARTIIPYMPHHVIQRGHNKESVFNLDYSYLYYTSNLLKFKEEYGCKLYAYCLMPNHVHLLIDPGEEPDNLSKLMKRISGRQTRFVNKRSKRSGSLWEGRFKSSIVSTNEYLHACCRYIELNPVQAGLVQKPQEYRWSSARSKVTEYEDSLVDLDPFYTDIGDTADERQVHYLEYLLEGIPDEEEKLLKEAIQREQITGSSKFCQQVEKDHGVKLYRRGPGRPRKEKKNLAAPIFVE